MLLPSNTTLDIYLYGVFIYNNKQPVHFDTWRVPEQGWSRTGAHKRAHRNFTVSISARQISVYGNLQIEVTCTGTCSYSAAID